MAVTIRQARMTVPAVPQATGPSKTKASAVALLYETDSALDTRFHVVFGTHPTTPATFADFAVADDFLVGNANSFSFNGLGAHNVVNYGNDGLTFGAANVGDVMWAAIFETTGALIAGSVPDAVFRIGPVTA